MVEPELFGDRNAALAWLDGERAGLVAAVGWGREERFTEWAMRLAGCLGVHLEWRRYFDDWIAVGESAREAALRAGDRHGQATAWNDLGGALHETGRAQEAIDALIRARDLFRAEGDRHCEAMAWNNLGGALRETGQLKEAAAAYGTAFAVFREFEDQYGEALTFHGRALVHETAHRPVKARACWLQAADAYTRANAPDQAAHARARAAELPE